MFEYKKFRPFKRGRGQDRALANKKRAIYILRFYNRNNIKFFKNLFLYQIETKYPRDRKILFRKYVK